MAFVASQACTSPSDCPDDSGCTEGRCQICPSCATGERCLKGQCLPSTCGGVTCPDGQACVDNRCTAANCLGVSCLSGTRCEAGQCVACAAVDSCIGGADDDCDGKTGCEDSDCAGRSCGAEGPCVSMLCRGGTCEAVPKVGGTVCRPSAGACDLEEKCDGASTSCPSDARVAPGTVCREASGLCDEAESCEANNPDCPADTFQAQGTSCRASQGPCDPEEACDGASAACPADAVLPSSAECSPASECELAAHCDGAGAACPARQRAPSGTECRPSQGGCDPAETCDGTSSACPADERLLEFTVCAAATGPCELPAVCDGTSPACPAKTFLGNATICGVASGACDLEERCTGSSAACPTDQIRPASFVCNPSLGPCDPAETCDGSTKACPADLKSGPSTVCAAAFQCRLESRCDGTNPACPAAALSGVGTVCRAGSGACEADALCSGTSETCPANALRGPGVSCRTGLGPCDPEEFCDGVAAACPADVRKLATDVCDASTGPCETTSYCDGSSALCPAKSLLGASTVCSPANGACDLEERCSGGSAACPTDQVQAAGFVCRASLGICDPQEVCDGTAKACPADKKLSTSDRCAVSSGVCEADAYCDGNAATCPAKALLTTTCRNAADVCDEPEACDGVSPTCPTDKVSATSKLCSAPSTYCDGLSTACPGGGFPTPPVFVSITPASPSKTSTTPQVKGTSSVDTVTIALYSNTGCTTQIGTGTKAQWEGAGLTATVPANQSTTIYAVATNAVPNSSPCTLMTTYVHDTLGPAAPAFVATVPATPTGPSFTVKGTSSADTATVTVYKDSGCATQVGTGTKAVWEGAGVAVTISPNATTPLYGKAFDALGNASTCVSLTTYTAVRGWTWMAGVSTPGAIGIAGATGVGGPSYQPGSRRKQLLFATGTTIWMFGGSGCTTTNCSMGKMNDLWRFDGTNWAWMTGTNSTDNVVGVYGTKGLPAAGNTPGSREVPVGTVDAAGNLWIFGGWGNGTTQGNKWGELNDLWKYTPSTGMWTWMSGGTCASGQCKSPDREPTGLYGTKGVAAAGNVPGGRDSGVIWFDSAGDLWLFGGTGCDEVSCFTNTKALSDVWKYSPASGLWTWVAGPKLANTPANYGAKGVTVSANLPGSRYLFGGAYSAAKGLQFFGGYGYDSAGAKNDLADLWTFDGTNYTWVGGPNVVNALAVPGTKGVPATTNWPGGRDSFGMAADPVGSIYMYGGNGCDAATCSASSNWLGDLWWWDGARWTWLTGSSVANEAGVWGTKGVIDTLNTPGGRAYDSMAVDSTGAVWLFGGERATGRMSDLWRYQ
ncbi:MAG TPA: hypothetical protein VGK67_27670 [Myxococcales bacterium]